MSKDKKSREILRRDWDEGEEMTLEEDHQVEHATTEAESIPQEENSLMQRLEKLREQFATEANQLTVQADEAEERVWRWRASAASLREAAEGVDRAIREFRQQWDVTTKRLKEREATRRDVPPPDEEEAVLRRIARENRRDDRKAGRAWPSLSRYEDEPR